MSDTRAHWNNAYTIKAEDQVSWFLDAPRQSLAMIEAASSSHGSSVIDVGGGASRLVYGLLEAGYADLTVLDISNAALEKSKSRLKDRAIAVDWITADITDWQPQRTWNIWHDRAVFHFLTDAEDQNKYITALTKATLSGASVIMSTFALDGPERCSGLPVQRYSPATLAERLGPDFLLFDQAAETHRTPFNTTQQFCYAAFRRR